MNKKQLYSLIGIIAILLIALPVAFVLGRKSNEDDQDSNNQNQEDDTTSDNYLEPQEELKVDENDFKSEKVIVESLKANDVISKETEIKGQALKTWFFEGDFPVFLKNQTNETLASGYAKIDTSKFNVSEFYEYEGDYVPFEVEWQEFDIKNNEVGMILFEKDNPSGKAENYDSYEFPVRFNAIVQTISVNVYFYNSSHDPNVSDCSRVFPVKRVIPFTVTVGKASIDELLKGPSAQETKLGYGTNIPENVKLNSISIENKIAYVDFDNTLQYQVGGSCRVEAIRSQITETLKQFRSVEDVVISIQGEHENILQP